MSFQAKTNQIIGTIGSVARQFDGAQTPSATTPQPSATTQKPVKPSYDDQVAEMANKMAMNLLTSKKGQMETFKSRVDSLKKMTSDEWFEQAVKEEKQKNKLASDALMKNALDAEALERGAK